MRERARAEQAERAGRERKGPFVDPQAAQESDELMNSLNAMNAGSSMFKQNAAPATKKADDKPKKKVTIVEEDSEEEEEDVPIKKKQPVARDGFEPSPKFTGGRPGWVFKAGPDGLGYYREGPVAPPKPAGMRSLAIEEDSEEEEDVPIKKAAKRLLRRSLQRVV